ncbi:LamG-like jellyroll fold domain-containing protein [Pleurocapsa sp. PCC 7319]|uniref:LamG-like jellyroll fold domain-containing protein n=1 Tax=Pleurocapsa sp. PCC 7319 TaxID=118161 RepID=UPI00034CF9CB|nr:LamG-like jellyroll fold domain-containing protein [Pleurocapsa sp. PCC 7319]
MLAYGFITFLGLDSEYYLKYEIDAETGFKIYWIKGLSKKRYSQQKLSDFLSESSVAQILQSGTQEIDKGLYQASLILSGLPASPNDAFYNIRITYNGSSFSLGVKSDEPFGFSPKKSTHFKDLDLTFTQELQPEKSDKELTVNGSVKAVISGQEILLEAQKLNQSQLIFQYNSANPQTIPIKPWGNLALTKFTVKSGLEPLQPQVLYLFGEKSGEWIYDYSLINTEDAPAIDLHIKTLETIERKLGSILVKEKTLIASQNDNLEDSGESSAAKLIKAFRKTNKLSIAAWIKPSPKKQLGPARIVTLSQDIHNRYVTLGQNDAESGTPENRDQDRYVVRFRINKDDKNGTKEALTTNYDPVGTEPIYIVYTFSREKSDDKNAKLYLYFNGFLKKSQPVVIGDHPWGNDSNDSAFKLALGNEVSFLKDNRHDRSWEGELYEVAIYNSALTPEAIYQRYYPSIDIEGELELANMPNPLTTLTAKLTLEKDLESQLLLQVSLISNSRQVTPQFEFTKIDLEWEADLSDSPTWDFKAGEVESTLWGNSIIFTVKPSNTDRLVLNSSEIDIQLESGEINILKGLDLSLKPNNTGELLQMSSTTAISEIELPRSRDGRPFDWTVDFKLLFTPHDKQKNKFAPLAIENGKVVLKGTWLGDSLVFHGLRRNEQFVLQGERRLSLPFQVILGPIFEPGTSQKIVERVAIASVMDTTLTFELTELGFLARVSGSFNWTDQGNTEDTVNTFTVPEFTLSRPPLTPNQILEAVLEQLISQADVIFADQFHHSADYYFTMVEQNPLIYLGDRDSSAAQAQTTTLPQLFSTAAYSNNTSTTAGIFALTENEDQSCTLTITPTGTTQSDLAQLKTDYSEFISKLDTNSHLIQGALTMVKTRIAERIPLLVDQILYYYYGLDAANGAVDLQAGMRLRVDYQNYQFVHPGQSTANSGFVGSGTSYYTLNSYRDETNLMINFDGFLSQIQPYVTTDIATVGAGSSLDLVLTDFVDQPL